MKFQALFAPLLLALSGCATLPVPVEDSEPLDPSSAYVLLSPCYSFGEATFHYIDMQLLRLEKNNTTTEVFLPDVRNYKRLVVKVKPGFYYLSTIGDSSNIYLARLESGHTLFEARAGRLNYPGEWVIGSTVHDTSVWGTVGAGGGSSISYTMKVSAKPDETVQDFTRKHFPALSAKLPLVYTKLSAAQFQ